MHTLFGYIDIFPQHEVHSGHPCLILGDFHKNPNFSALNGRTVDAQIIGLSSKLELEHRGMILNFGAWVYGQPDVYGIILKDKETTLEKGSVVSAIITVPDLGGV